MRIFFAICLTLPVVCIKSPASNNAIRWDSKLLTITATGDEFIKFRFSGKNISDSKLVIKAVKASCSCTDVNYPENCIKSGKTFEIEGVLKIKENESLQREKIYVELEDGLSELNIVLTNPYSINISPRVLYRGQNETSITIPELKDNFEITSETNSFHWEVTETSPNTFRVKMEEAEMAEKEIQDISSFQVKAMLTNNTLQTTNFYIVNRIQKGENHLL